MQVSTYDQTLSYLRSLPRSVLTSITAQRIEQVAQARQAEKLSTVEPPLIDDWINTAVTIEEPQGDLVSIVPFHLWPKQQEALQIIKNQTQVIILKARQLGMSWLTVAFAVWLCIYHANKLVMVFSKDQDSANEMIRRAKGIFQRLNDKPCQLSVDNVTTIGWSNGSRIKSFAATEDAGSSYTASLTIIDEFAKMRYAEELYTSVKPTIADGGKMIVISTARGTANPFHNLWEAAIKGANSFKAIFLDWQARPDRTVEWYSAQEADAISSAHHRQEYPSTPDEAFVSIGEDRFLSSILWWDACRSDLSALDQNDPVILAMDAGISNDSFGVVGVSRNQDTNQICVRYARRWLPPSGGEIDFDEVENEVERITNTLNVLEVTYDPYQLHSTAKRMQERLGIRFKAFDQGKDRLIADKQLLDLIVQKRLAHDGDPILREHIDNANAKYQEDRTLRLIKRTGALKIDLAVALSMACARAIKLNI